MGAMNDDDQKITTEDKELADMIAGLNSGVSASVPTPPPLPPKPTPVPPAPISTTPTGNDFKKPIVASVVGEPANPLQVTDTSELKGIKKDVLNELKPLVDKLDIPAEEKFDTLLLLIRSTDDKSLLASAHDAAKAIPDDQRRATALLDIIKEIDFFENPS